VRSKREVDLQWRACQGCPYIVKIIDVYENLIKGDKRILFVVMEVVFVIFLLSE
jgi:hypothetical protein